MPIIYRYQKNAPLTSAEIDGNFEELVKRLEALENVSAAGESIGKIDQKGDVLYITGTLGTLLGEVKLPVLTYGFRGLWQPQTPYAFYDVVTKEGKSWVCTVPHDSEPAFDPKNWKLLIDVTTLLQKASNAEKLIVYSEQKPLPQPHEGRIAFYDAPEKMILVYADGKRWRTVQDLTLEDEDTSNAE